MALGWRWVLGFAVRWRWCGVGATLVWHWFGTGVVLGWCVKCGGLHRWALERDVFVYCDIVDLKRVWC